MADGMFTPMATYVTIVVDSGAQGHVVDEKLTPGLRHGMRDEKNLKEPKTSVAVGNKKVFAATAGALWGYLSNQTGQPNPVCASSITVPGLGRNFFSPA